MSTTFYENRREKVSTCAVEPRSLSSGVKDDDVLPTITFALLITMKSFAVAALAGAASAAWAPPAYGGESSSAPVEAPSAPAYSAPSAPAYSAPSAPASSAPSAPAYSQASQPPAYAPSSVATSSAPSAPVYGGSSASASSSMATYACNPAHSYPNGAQCVSTYGTLSLVTPSSSVPGAYGTSSVPSYPKPTGGYGGSANGTQGGPDSYVTQIVTAYTTVCPYATTLTTNGATYTATESETLTITDCPCEATMPAQSYVPETTTEVVTSFTTTCPYDTTFTAGPSTYTATSSQVITVTDCGDEGCTRTNEVPATWVVPTYSTVYPSPSAPTTVTIGSQTYPVSEETTIVVTAPTSYATYTSVVAQPEQPTSYVIESTTYPVSEATTITYSKPTQGGVTVTAPYSSIFSAPPAGSTPAGPVRGQPSGYPVPQGNSSSPVSPNLPQQTGNGAEKLMAGGAAFAALVGALFL